MKLQPTVIPGDPMILCTGSSACQSEKLNSTISTPKPSSYDTHVLAGLKAGLIWCQFPNQERVHVLPYQCLVKMESNERILKCRQRNRMKKNHHSGGSKRNLFHDMLDHSKDSCWGNQLLLLLKFPCVNLHGNQVKKPISGCSHYRFCPCI